MFIAISALAVTARADSVVCGDGSTSRAGRGACSHHGGIAPRAQAHEQEPRVRCEDGTLSDTGRGACSHHGGMAKHSPVTRHEAPLPRPDRNTSFTPDRDRREHDSDARPRDIPEHAPWPNANASEPTARCKDGTLSYSAHHEGTCSRHGGVARWER